MKCLRRRKQIIIKYFFLPTLQKIDKKKTSFPNYSSSSEKSTIIQIQDLKNRISVLESQLLSKDTVISSLNCEIEVGKLSKAGLTRTMESQNVEITMQKVTIKHLQDALVELKKSGVNNNSNSHQTSQVPCGKVFHV